MQKLPETPDRQRGWHMCKKKEPSEQKEESCLLSAVTSRVTIPKPFLLVVEGTMRVSLYDALANPSTSSSCLLYKQPMIKNSE